MLLSSKSFGLHEEQEPSTEGSDVYSENETIIESEAMTNYDYDRIQKVNGPIGILTLEIVEATGVPPMDYSGSSDPYIRVKFGTKVYRTPIIKRNLNPQWNHQFRILLYKEQLNYDMTLQLYDWDKISSNDFISSVKFPLAPVTSEGASEEFQAFELPYEVKLKKRKRLLGKIAGNKQPKIIRVRAKYLAKEKMEKMFWNGIVEYFDDDGNGTISLDELGPLLEGINPRPGEGTIDATQELLNEIDTNGDGVISKDELYEYMKKNSENIDSRIFSMANELMWQVFLLMEEGCSVGDMIMSHWQLSPTRELESAASDDKKLKKKILVQVRKTGKLEVEMIPNYIRVSMRLMYSSRLGRKTVSGAKIKKMLKQMTERQGRTYNSPASCKQIQPFINFHQLNLNEVRDDMSSFSNFNEFFYRKLKEDARPVAEPQKTSVIVSPADCRLSVYPAISKATEIWIKGKNFSLANLLQDEILATVFEGGSIVIARLAPQDYHRFHSPVSGTLQEFHPIDGAYYTVNPIAVNKPIDVFCGNKRLVTTIETLDFGQVAFIAVGATMVGSINMTKEPSEKIQKGEELGYFAFGGSTCIILFRKGTVTFDDDLIINSSKPIETLVRVGEQIGKAIRPYQ